MFRLMNGSAKIYPPNAAIDYNTATRGWVRLVLAGDREALAVIGEALGAKEVDQEALAAMD